MNQDDLSKGGTTDGRILLHPTCDQRGWVTQVLNAGWSRADGSCVSMNPESVFFAWLLDLPAGIAPEMAASTLLKLARQSAATDQVAAPGEAIPSASTDNDADASSADALYSLPLQHRERVVSMLQDLVNRAEQEAVRPKRLLRQV